MAALIDIKTPERGVLVLDKNRRVVYANNRATDILGMKLNDLVGSELPDEIGSRVVTDEEVVEDVLSTLIPGVVIHRYSAPVFDSEGSITGRVEILSDISVRRKLEKEILQRNTELAELNRRLQEAQEQLIHSERLRALGEMAAGVAHDINNSLGIILGNAQLARRKMRDDPNLAECIDAIELAAKDAAETVRKLRELGKPVDFSKYEKVDLSDIARDVLKAVMPTWRDVRSGKSCGIKVRTDFEDGCIVMGNPTELREALANILINAAQAIDGKGTIEVRVFCADQHAAISVKDDGVGMDEETQERLFDPFFTTRGAQGTGLGMSMVDAIAMRHRGEVTIDSVEDKGTTVTISIPLIGKNDTKMRGQIGQL